MFFCNFLGQYSAFAPLSLKDWDSTALQALQVSKTLYCPNVFWVQACNNAVLSQKTQKKTLFRVSRSKIGTVRCFCFSVSKRLGQYSTSGPPGAENAVLSQCFWVESCKNAVLSQSLSWRFSKVFFLSFLGQYGVFASLSLKDWDSTALQAFQVYQWDSYKKCEPLNNRNFTKINMSLNQ